MKPLLINHIYPGDVRKVLRRLPDESVDCIVTSPPYWGLRDYGVSGQLGLEPTPQEYIRSMVRIFRQCKRILKPTGTLWLNIGDSYAGSGKGSNPDGSPHESKLQAKQGTNRGAISGIALKTPTRKIKLKPGDLVGIPWRLAFALQEDGWYLRQDIIWHKRNPMPESVTSRCTKAHEYIFLLSKRKSGEYYYDAEAIKEEASTDTHARVAREQRQSWEHKSAPVGIRNGIRPRKIAPAGNGMIKSNESFEAALTELVESRNKRSVWSITSQAFPEAHFATFPQELIEPCIAAGTSEKGNCSECGAPWERIVERVDSGRTQKMADGWDTGPGSHGTIHRSGREKGITGIPVMVNETIGWQPSCKCDCEDVTPPVVFDPFMGAGTTALVARKKLRHFAGIELNPEYIAIAQRRLKRELGMFL